MDSSYTSPSTKPLFRGTQIVWYLLGIIEFLLLFRFILKLLGANPLAGFTSFIYGVTHFLAAPFLTVFRTSRITDGSVFEGRHCWQCSSMPLSPGVLSSSL